MFIERLLIQFQVDLVAIMGGGYPGSDAMWPFGSEFNFDCGKVLSHVILFLRCTWLNKTVREGLKKPSHANEIFRSLRGGVTPLRGGIS